MKKCILFTTFTLLAMMLHAADTLNHPQKIIIDAAHHRYLVSNYSVGGDIIAIDSLGNLSCFVENAGMVDAMEIVGDTVYGSALGGRAFGYDLATGTRVMNLDLSGEGVSILTGFVADSAGILYCSERFGDRIFKINPKTKTYWLYVEGNGIAEPNGLLYEPENNRILVCLDQPNPPVLAINLSDSTITTVANTNLPGSDGIAKDKYGHYYITGYELPGIYRIKPGFNSAPELIFPGNRIIYPTYNEAHHSLLFTYYDANDWGELFLDDNLLNNPESVVYDAGDDRYLVSNCGNGNIVQIDSSGQQSYFNTELSYTLGLCTVGDTLFVSSNGVPYKGVVGFSLLSGEMVCFAEIQESELLNDITADLSGNLYVTDCDANKIFKVRITDMIATTFVDSGLGYPNGILYDEPRNRLLVLNCLLPDRPMLAVSLADSSLSPVVETHLNSIDGLTADEYGNFYFSSWATDKVYRYDETFTNPPEVISSGHTDPADIFFNTLDNVLAVPNYTSDMVEFIPVNFTGIRTTGPNGIRITDPYPNPFSDHVTVSFHLPKDAQTTVMIYDVLGNSVNELIHSALNRGEHTASWFGKDSSGKPVAGGTYIFSIVANGFPDIRKPVILSR